MKYLLDTNVCVNLLRGASDKLRDKIENIADSQIGISSVVSYELHYGAYKSADKQKTMFILRDFLSRFENVPFNEEMAGECGRIRFELESSGMPIGPYDTMIAATALAINMVLVTHNTKEFSRVKKLRLEDWE